MLPFRPSYTQQSADWADPRFKSRGPKPRGGEGIGVGRPYLKPEIGVGTQPWSQPFKVEDKPRKRVVTDRCRIWSGGGGNGPHPSISRGMISILKDRRHGSTPGPPWLGLLHLPLKETLGSSPGYATAVHKAEKAFFVADIRCH